MREAGWLVPNRLSSSLSAKHHGFASVDDGAAV
jgi:hypothetical protein